MLRTHDDKQIRMEFVSIEELVPQDHLLRKIERVVDFSFIREKVKDLYCADNGRPAVDPVILFKMLFLGYLFGVRSERQLVREIQVNVAYRWFLGFGLTDKFLMPRPSVRIAGGASTRVASIRRSLTRLCSRQCSASGSADEFCTPIRPI
jgi:transposase